VGLPFAPGLELPPAGDAPHVVAPRGVLVAHACSASLAAPWLVRACQPRWLVVRASPPVVGRACRPAGGWSVRASPAGVGPCVASPAVVGPCVPARRWLVRACQPRHPSFRLALRVPLAPLSRSRRLLGA